MDIYGAAEALIAELQASGQLELAGVLHHRLHRVAWTTGTELLDELHRVLTQALDAPTARLPESARARVVQVLAMVNRSRAGAGLGQDETRDD